jgi:quercetin dioxygenase-like cupin family protein
MDLPYGHLYLYPWHGGIVMIERTIRIVRLFADQNGESHFKDESITTMRADFAPPAPAISVAALGDAGRSLLLLLPPGWYGDLHRAPARQLMVVVSGALEVAASDGEIRVFRPGDVVQVEDTVGRGHSTRSVDGESIVAVVQS